MKSGNLGMHLQRRSTRNISMGTNFTFLAVTALVLAAIQGRTLLTAQAKGKRWSEGLMSTESLASRSLLTTTVREGRNNKFYSGLTRRLDTLATSCPYHMMVCNNNNGSNRATVAATAINNCDSDVTSISAVRTAVAAISNN